MFRALEGPSRRRRARMATDMRLPTATLTGIPGVAGKRTLTEAGTTFRSLVSVQGLHMVGTTAQRDNCGVGGNLLLAAGAATRVRASVVVAGVHGCPVRGAGGVVVAAAAGVEEGSVEEGSGAEG